MSVVFATFSVALSACGEGNAMSRMGGTFALAIGDGGLAYDPQEAARSPYALLEASIGSAPAAMAVLAKAEGARRYWVGSDRVAVVTENGRVVATAGLPSDLRSTQLWDPDPLSQQSLPRGAVRRLVDLSYRNLFALPLSCEWTRRGRDTVDVFGDLVVTDVWAEKCVAQGIAWEFENLFWRDSEGRVRQSLQHLVPDTPPMHTKLLRAYREQKS